MPLTRISDRALILAVAQAAIISAIYRAETISRKDKTLGELEYAEEDRLRTVLFLLIPEIRCGIGCQQQLETVM